MSTEPNEHQQYFTFTGAQLERAIRLSIQQAHEYQTTHHKTPGVAASQAIDDLLGNLEHEMDVWLAGEGYLEWQSGVLADQGLSGLALEVAMLAYKNDLRDAKERIEQLQTDLEAERATVRLLKTICQKAVSNE